ncbi:hypothetical protein TrVFT333_000662 [Trichoderma virens FT-333]|nr:hypothetical protein TrVFT333_000662 [Trichoderma virens FT-333]
MKSWLSVRSAAILGAGFFLPPASAREVECPNPAEIVIHEPAELICCGSTMSTTYTRITTECSGIPAYVTPGVPIPEAECVTTTQPWTGTVTETITIHASGRAPGTKIIKVPGGNPDCITTTIGWTGTVTETVTIPAYGRGPSTIIVKTPCEHPDYITKTPGEIIIKTPHAHGPLYVTKTLPWTGSMTVTYTEPPRGTNPGTVIVRTPQKYVTEPWDETDIVVKVGYIIQANHVVWNSIWEAHRFSWDTYVDNTEAHHFFETEYI